MQQRPDSAGQPGERGRLPGERDRLPGERGRLLGERGRLPGERGPLPRERRRWLPEVPGSRRPRSRRILPVPRSRYKIGHPRPFPSCCLPGVKPRYVINYISLIPKKLLHVKFISTFLSCIDYSRTPRDGQP